MANYLVIVESPAKVKTIKKFLGSNYEVDASGGHVRDLPKSQLGFDAEHDYEPKYITIRGKGDVLAKLRKEVKKADKIYLATDPDREGEAISWHLMKALKLDEQKGKDVYRISFNEITKNAVKASFKTPRTLDMNLVNAQQTRRMLDRMVGKLLHSLDMSLCQVNHMDVVTHAGAVRGIIIITEYVEIFKLSNSHLCNIRNQVVGDSLGIFSNQAAFMGTDGIEVTQKHHIPLIIRRM